MLHSLHVRNLAVVEEVGVEFGPGLNVLTGATGAGKSILVDSLALLAGARASADLIRSGSGSLSVSGLFAPLGAAGQGLLAEAGVAAEGDQVLVRREINRQAANRVFVNDQPVTLRLLGRLAPGLLRIHTQREELGLLEPEVQRAWLDRSGSGEAAPLLAGVRSAYERYLELAERLERVSGDDRRRRERIDLLRFQAGEIDAAELVAGEEDELRRERALLRHAEAIARALGGSESLLFEDEAAAAANVARSQALLEEVTDWLPEAADWLQDLEEVRIRLEELVGSMRDRMQGVAAKPKRLDWIEDRLAQLERLLRKYGGTSEEILDLRCRVADELVQLEGDSEQREELAARVDEALEAYRTAAAELSRGRSRWGRRLARRVHGELRDLALARARFSVRLGRRARAGSWLTVGDQPVEFSAEGYDRVSYLLAANPGEPAQQLSRVASGGELSRVYLALQLAVRGDGAALPATLIFDEVDAGIGGSEAAALGLKLRRLASGGQILVVTHLPQVASHADRHFRVGKRQRGGRTVAEVEPLAAGDRVHEIARMLAGRQVTELSLSHAEELIAVAGRDGG